MGCPVLVDCGWFKVLVLAAGLLIASAAAQTPPGGPVMLLAVIVQPDTVVGGTSSTGVVKLTAATSADHPVALARAGRPPLARGNPAR